MRAFTTNDLNKQVGEVTDAASRAPVLITRHAQPRFVMMSYEHYQRIQGGADPRRVYAVGETPEPLSSMFASALDRLSRDEGDGR